MDTNFFKNPSRLVLFIASLSNRLILFLPMISFYLRSATRHWPPHHAMHVHRCVLLRHHGHWPCHACRLVYFNCFHVAPPANPKRSTRKPANFHTLCCLKLRITYACIVAPLATETCDTIMALMAILRCQRLQTTAVCLACIFYVTFLLR